MSGSLDFWFDFSSPYGYFASERIEALAARHDRAIASRPMLLGPVFKQVGTAPLTSIPLMGEYSKRDLARTARFHGIPFRLPSRFPIATQAAGRIVTWLGRNEPQRVVPVVHALFRAYFVADRDISEPGVTLAVAADAGMEAAAARAAIEDPAIKDAFRADVDAAIARGVFGSPFVIVDGEPFWGFDRFDQLDRWLATGGF
jgi:2-hydroxychromene-2-carboxylate isomerase